MDYEIAYKEALNRAKLLKYNPKKVLLESENIPVSDYIFPELKESEDEKVRKELLNYVIKGKESYYDIQQYGLEKFENWIAWLEKQDKQKPIEWDEEDEKMYNIVHDLTWESFKTSRRLDIPPFGTIMEWLKQRIGVINK